jgi:TolB-like protein/Flp pilus assembly protein TadD
MALLGTFLGELRRRRVMRVAVGYGVVAWLVVQVADAIFAPLGLPGWALTLVVVLAILGFPVSLVLAWAFEVTPGGVRREVAVGKTTPQLLVAAPSVAADPVANATEGAVAAVPAASVAVLPFVDMSESQDQGYFCDGIAEEILNSLSHVRGLSVAARTASFQFKGHAGSIADIANRLNVAAILEGSVRKSGDQLRVTAQLVAAKDGFHLWSERFDVVAADVFAVQDRIAASIASALRVSLRPEERVLMQLGQTRSLEAYDHYLRGLSYFHSFSWRTMEYARLMFLKAIEVDPGFGRAWAGLAYAAGYIYQYREESERFRQEALDASARALECCDTAEAHTARGVALSLSREYAAAEAEFRRALELNPDQYEALWLYGRLAHERGDYPKAAEVWQRATEVNAGEYQAAILLHQVYLALQQPDKAREWQERGLARALQHLERHPDDVRALYLSAVIQAELGQHEQARRSATRALQLEPDDGIVAYNLACMYAVMKEPDRAVDLLQRSTVGGRINLAWLEHDATLAPLRGHPRFDGLLEELRSKAGR